VGLRCEYLPTSTVVYYFKQHTMSNSANGVPPTLVLPHGIFLVLLSIMFRKTFFMIGLSISKYAIVVASSRLHMHTYMISQIFRNRIFWIKIIFLPKYLTSSN
jgi:hypothetical protein